MQASSSHPSVRLILRTDYRTLRSTKEDAVTCRWHGRRLASSRRHGCARSVHSAPFETPRTHCVPCGSLLRSLRSLHVLTVPMARTADVDGRRQRRAPGAGTRERVKVAPCTRPWKARAREGRDLPTACTPRNAHRATARKATASAAGADTDAGSIRHARAASWRLYRWRMACAHRPTVESPHL